MTFMRYGDLRGTSSNNHINERRNHHETYKTIIKRCFYIAFLTYFICSYTSVIGKTIRNTNRRMYTTRDKVTQDLDTQRSQRNNNALHQLNKMMTDLIMTTNNETTNSTMTKTITTTKNTEIIFANVTTNNTIETSAAASPTNTTTTAKTANITTTATAATAPAKNTNTAMTTNTESVVSMIPPSDDSPSSFFKLRYDWTDLEPLSPMARRIVQHQSNCSLPLGNFGYRNRYGLGSDIHVWSQGLCNAMEANHRIRTIQPWIFWDQDACTASAISSTSSSNTNTTTNTPANTTTTTPTTTTTNTTVAHTIRLFNKEYMYASRSLVSSAMTCYFPKSEIQCPNDHEITKSHPTYDGAIFNITNTKGWVNTNCESIMNYADLKSRHAYRSAATEFLFTSVSPLLQQEAERQLPLVFQNVSQIPKDLITVHIRYGDKGREMQLVPMQQYVDAVHTILRKRNMNHTNLSTTTTTTTTTITSDNDKNSDNNNNNNNSDDDEVNIFLATEDPEAVNKFKELIPSNWNVYLDQYYVEMLPYRIGTYNGNPQMSFNLGGRSGLIALGSLLVAMEANDFVLTTASNWSRLLNELRESIINPRCNNCTSMIDLRYQNEYR